jgi:hypothetical protein
VRLALLAVAGLVLWRVLRRGREDERRVAVGWEDGSEIELLDGTPERERLVAIAADALR